MSVRVAPCTHTAARYAVMHWHYSKAMPTGRLVKFGVWEDRFIGAVIFGRGASPYLGTRLGLKQTESCELVRIALDVHMVPVTEIVTLARHQLTTESPGLRLIVSFADPFYGHHGGIYQAGNWIYLGTTGQKKMYRHPRTGRLIVDRLVSETGYVRQFGRMTPVPKPSQLEAIDIPGKHRYAYPLDRAMRRRLQPLALPYPRGSSLEGETSDLRLGRPGSTPGNRSHLTGE